MKTLFLAALIALSSGCVNYAKTISVVSSPNQLPNVSVSLKIEGFAPLTNINQTIEASATESTYTPSGGYVYREIRLKEARSVNTDNQLGVVETIGAVGGAAIGAGAGGMMGGPGGAMMGAGTGAALGGLTGHALTH